MSTQVRPSPETALLPEWLSHSFEECWWAGAALAAGDLVAVELSFLIGYALASYPAHLSPEQLAGIAAVLLALPLALFLAGLYPGYGINPVARLRVRVRATLLVLAGLIAGDYLIQQGGWSRGVLLGTASMAMFLPLASESLLIRWLTRIGCWGTPVAVLGAKRAGGEAIRKLRQHAEWGLVPVVRLEEGALAAWVTRHPAPNINLAVATAPQAAESWPFSKVIVVPELGSAPGLAGRGQASRLAAERLKRALDICLSLPLLILSAPVIGVLALCVKRVSPGPAFYSQVRGGQYGKPIRVWKLRTMWLDAELRLAEALAGDPERQQEWARSFKLRADPRVLPGLGRLLRRCSLDELPQFWNVLKGDMSMVGPRPFPYYHLERFDASFVRLREQVRPGITGLWQITVRGDSDLELQQSLDTYYIRNWSIGMDARILAKTLRAVVKGNGAY